MIALGVGFGLHRGGAAAAGGGAWTPADLTFTATKLRAWWHIDEVTLAANHDGTGGVPAVGDPVGLITSQAPDTSFNWTQSNGAAKPVRRADGIGVENQYVIGDLGSDQSANGITIAARVRKLSDNGDAWVGIGGHDIDPVHGASLLTSSIHPGKMEWIRYGERSDIYGEYDASALNWSTFHTVILTCTTGGLWSLYVDSDTPVSTATLAPTTPLTRDLIYTLTNEAIVRSRFFALDCFSGADIANLRAWLER